jgi:hypothetical protein
MNDQYRISDTDAATESATEHATGPRGVLRPALWAGLVLAAAANAVVSSIGANPLVGSAFGLVALVCAAVLIVNHYRNRAS